MISDYTIKTKLQSSKQYSTGKKNKKRHIDQWSSIGSSEINQHTPMVSDIQPRRQENTMEKRQSLS